VKNPANEHVNNTLGGPMNPEKGGKTGSQERQAGKQKENPKCKEKST